MDWRERRHSGVDISCFLFVSHCFPLGNAPPPACGPVGCPSGRLLPVDQQEHDPSGAKQSALKGTDMAWLLLGSCLSVNTRRLEGLGESLMPHAVVCLRQKPSQTKKDQRGILVAMLDFLDPAGPETDTSNFSTLRPHITLLL